MVIILEIYFYNLLTIMSLISVCFYKRKLIEAYPLCLDDTARIQCSNFVSKNNSGLNIGIS